MTVFEGGERRLRPPLPRRTAALARRSVWLPSTIIAGAVMALGIFVLVLLLQELSRA